MSNSTQEASVGGKIVIAFGAFLIIGAAFIVSSPLIAIVVFIMGIVAVIRGYGMRQGPPPPIRSSSTQRQCDQNLPKLVVTTLIVSQSGIHIRLFLD